MMNRGEIVFFKKAKASSHRTSPEFTYKGHGYGILLGNVIPFQKDPTTLEMIRTLGTTGFFSLNDIEDFLGTAARDTMVEKFTEKYYGKKIVMESSTQQELPLDIPPPDAL